MKKITLSVKTLILAFAVFGFSTAQAQMELRVLSEMSTRFNDVNDSGFGVNIYDYYDWQTNELIPVEQDAFMVQGTNNDANVVGYMFYDMDNFILQPGYRMDGEWTAIDFLPSQNPDNGDENTVYGISPNSKYITGQLNIGNNYGGFLFDTETDEMIATMDPGGEASAAYNVNDSGIMVGWVDRPDQFGTMRVPAYRTLDGEYHFIPEGQLPTETGVNAITDINNSNVMVGDFNNKPFIYDMTTNTFTGYDLPEGADYAGFASISENGVAVGYAEVGFQVRDAIIYHPSLGDQPIYIKDLLADNGVNVDTIDGLLGTAISISPNGQYIVGWVNGAPPFAEGWILYVEDLFLGKNEVTVQPISVHPNPVNDILHLNSKSTIDAVAIYSITGQEISNFSTTENLSQINVSALAQGVYLVKVSSNGNVENFKIVKN